MNDFKKFNYQVKHYSMFKERLYNFIINVLIVITGIVLIAWCYLTTQS